MTHAKGNQAGNVQSYIMLKVEPCKLPVASLSKGGPRTTHLCPSAIHVLRITTCDEPALITITLIGQHTSSRML